MLQILISKLQNLNFNGKTAVNHNNVSYLAFRNRAGRHNQKLQAVV